jgi:hypothetical protein
MGRMIRLGSAGKALLVPFLRNHCVTKAQAAGGYDGVHVGTLVVDADNNPYWPGSLSRVIFFVRNDAFRIQWPELQTVLDVDIAPDGGFNAGVCLVWERQRVNSARRFDLVGQIASDGTASLVETDRSAT